MERAVRGNPVSKDQPPSRKMGSLEYPHEPGGLQPIDDKELVAREYEAKGYKVVKEYPLGGGKAVDLLVTRGNDRICIEIETGKSDIKENVRKCKEAGFEKIRIVKT